MKICSALFVALTCALLAPSAHGASSGWQKTQGAKLRFLARVTQAGTVEAALHIVLEDGWKTYWKVPGASGVPPQIVLTDAGSGAPLLDGDAATIHFPVPKVFSDGSGWIAGYDGEVAFPIDIRPPMPVRSIGAAGMVGICSDICIPVPFDLTVDLQAGGQSSLDEHRILSKFRARLPKHDVADIAVQHVDTASAGVEVSVPEGTSTAFWLDLQQGMPVEAAHIAGTVAKFSLPPAALKAHSALVVAGDTSAVVSLP